MKRLPRLAALIASCVFISNFLYSQGNTLDFDGADDIIQVVAPTGIPLGASPRTVEAWFTVEKDLQVDTEGAILQYGTPIFGQVFGLITSANDPGKFTVFDNTTNLVGTTTLKQNIWYHVAVTYDGSNLILYINGQPEASKTVSLNTILSASGLTIGERPGVGNWDGRIDEIRIWDVARSQSEILSTIDIELTGSETNLVAYYDFDQGNPGLANPTVTTLPDETASGLDATLNNFALTGTTSNWLESTAFTPEIAVYRGSDNTGTELLNFQPIPVNYGNITAGGSETLTFAIENTSLFDLVVSDIAATGDFSVTSSTSFTVSPGATTTFTVEFSAAAAGIANGNVIIQSDDADEPNFSFPVTGTIGVLTPKLYWTDEVGSAEDEIDRSNLDGSSTQNAYYSGFSVDIKGIAVDTQNNMIFWTNTDDGTIRCGRIGDTGFTGNGFVLNRAEETSGVVEYLGLDVDGAAGKVYWCDATNDQVRRVNFDGSNPEVLINIDAPRDVALDVAGGKMYYVANPSFTPQLWRANLDGSSPQMIYSSGSTLFEGVALDLVNNKVYWTESAGGVSRANLDGTGDEGVSGQVTSPTGIDLDVDNQMMYIVDGASIVQISYNDDPAVTVQSGALVTSPQDVALDTRSVVVNEIGGVVADDYNALVELYNSTDGANWTSNTNWLSGDVNTWFGVTVTGNRVTSLQLNENQLDGVIPSSITDMTELVTLNLEKNNLTGSIPSAIGNLVNLDYIDLEGNQLTGSLPTSMGDLVNLTEWDVMKNQLSGFIPTEVGNMTSLQILELNENELTGSIPTQIGNLSNLTFLSLERNMLSGSIPSEVGDLTALTFIDLEGNELTGSLPTSLGNLVNLTELDLMKNQLSGSIPVEIGSMSSLQVLELNENQMDGAIPDQLGNLSNLQSLRLEANQFAGAVPSSFQSLTALTDLRLQQNALEDLPDLSGLTGLTNFQVADNQLEFDDIEPNVGITGFVYSPQAPIVAPDQFDLRVGDELDIPLTIGGSNNVYQWSKDAVDITGQTTDNLNIASVALADDGVYLLTVTNTVATDLTLLSETIDVTVTENQPPGVIYVFYIEEHSPVGTLIGTVSATDADGDPLTYTIASGNTNNAFVIAENGDLTVNDSDALDFETSPSIALMVEVNDGQGGITVASVTVNLIDIDEDVLGIADQIEGLTIYPNPITGPLYLKLENIDPRALELKLFALDGTAVKVPTSERSIDGIRMDFTGISQGVYTLWLNYNGTILSKNLIVK